jgi:hypothetical protein
MATTQTPDLLPREGPSATAVERLLEWLAPHHPAFANRIKGAPRAMVDRYAKLAGFGESASDLPPSFTAYLLAMGLDNAGLLQTFRIVSKADELVDYYEESLRDEPDDLDADFPVAATYIVGDQVSFDRRDGSVEPALVDSSCGEPMRRHAGSWEWLMMQAAMLQIEPRRLAHGAWMSSSSTSAADAVTARDAKGRPSAAAAVDAMAQRLSLQPAWFGDAANRIAIGASASLLARCGDDNVVMLRAFAADPQTLRQIEQEALATLGAQGGPLKLVGDALKEA